MLRIFWQRIIMAKNSVLAIIIKGILLVCLFFIFCFLFFLKGAKYARKYCALMFVVRSFYFYHGIFACTEQIHSPDVKVALDVYCGSRGTLWPVFTTCAAPGPLWVPFPQDKSLFFKDSQPWSLSPKKHMTLSVPTGQAEQHEIRTPWPSGQYLPLVRAFSKAQWSRLLRGELLFGAQTFVIKASQNCYSNKIPNVYGVCIICEAFT